MEQEQLAKPKRIVSYDITRTLAIILVVLCHATELVYKVYFSNPSLTDPFTKMFTSAAFTLGRLGVPLFLFLTGALVLKKQIDKDEDILTFYKKNLLPLIFVNIAWVIIYNIYFYFHGELAKISVENIIRELLFMTKVPLPNMWYIPMIVGMYIGIPFVAKIVKHFTAKSIKVASGVVFVSCFVFSFVNIVLKIIGVDSSHYLSLSLDLSFLGGVYGLYILIGNWVSRQDKTKIKTIWLALIALLSFIATCFVQILSRTRLSHYKYDTWYDSPLILICGVCLFLIINRLDYSRLKKKLLSFFTFASRSSLAVFFVHIIIQQLLVVPITPLELLLPVKLFILFIVSFVASLLLCYLLSKNKFLARYVLLIK